MKTSRALKASRSLREGFAKASRRLREGFSHTHGGFLKASRRPRAPPFGNDSSDNDKPLVWEGAVFGLLISLLYVARLEKKQAVDRLLSPLKYRRG